MKVVFIAGPISNGGTLQPPETAPHITAAVVAGLQLLDAGFAVLIPQLSWLIDPYGQHPWYEMDLELVRRSDAVLRMPGSSFGADREVVLADEMAIPVYHSVAEVLAWR